MNIPFRIEKRKKIGFWQHLLSIVAALVFGLGICAFLIKGSGANVIDAYTALFLGAFGSTDALLATLVQATPLIFTGLAMVVSFRSEVINLGVEGQFVAGTMAAAWVSMNFAELPSYLLIPLTAIGGMIAGALWGLIPALLKAKLDTSEVLSTVILNYIIHYFLSYLLSGPWQPPSEYLMQTSRFSESTFWPTFFDSQLHLGFFIGLACAVLLAYFIQKTSFGYELRAVGENRIASKYKGIRIEFIIILAMMLSGALGGLAGAGEISGIHHRLRMDISKGYGWTGILIALLGQLNPFGVIVAAIFYGGLITGSVFMFINTSVPTDLVEAIQGILMFVLLATQTIIQYRLRRVDDNE